MILIVSMSLAQVGTVWQGGHNRSCSRLPMRETQSTLQAATGRQAPLRRRDRWACLAVLLAQGWEQIERRVVQYGIEPQQRTSHDGLADISTLNASDNIFTF